MARRSDHSKEEIQALAVKHALKLIEEKGEKGFNARDIAQRMGYTVGTLYYIFKDMEALRFHVSAAILDMFYTETMEGLKNKKNKLNYHIKKYIQFSQDYQNLWMFLYGLDDMTKKKVPGWYLDKIQTFYLLSVESLAPYVNDKRKVHQAAQTILSSVHGMCVLSIRGNRTREKDFGLESMARHMIKNYLRGLNNP